MSCAYYNEHDPKAAAWLRELIKEGHIAAGIVDERDIQDVQPNELSQYTQCHFFAGIGGWSYALRLAGWPDDAPVWTGSCPCQPFSAAGKRLGTSDIRHLWPTFFRLIAQCRPAIAFGEQVASKDGREWLAGVRLDLESVGYAVGCADLCAASVSAPHHRQRLYWVADSDMSDKDQRAPGRKQPLHHKDGGDIENLGVTARQPLGECRQSWQQSEAIECADGWRRIEPGAQPLVDGLPGRLDLLRGYGNAIVPQVAAEFVKAYRETLTHAHPNTHEA